MKKSILATSIAAAVFGLGVTTAQAAVEASTDGTGNILLVPYYSAQAGNATLLSITNTDTTNAKAVKVRFRGAANSDDVFDFQLFLSPADVWTARVGTNEAGVATLTTTDTSCTKPASSVLNATPFITTRLDPALDAAGKANGTREGYVEIINMADIAPQTISSTATDIYNAIKHPANKAPGCATAKYVALDSLTQTETRDAHLITPTGKIMANWTIINTTNAAAWSGQATALKLTNPVMFYQPQTATAVANAHEYTSDPLFLNGGYLHTWNASTQSLNATLPQTVAAIATPGLYDLPDLSTKLDTDYTTPTLQVKAIQNVLGKASVIAEYATESSINGSTDWAFTMPTRRYAVAMAYSKISATDDGRRFNAEYQGSESLANLTSDTDGGTERGTSATAVFNGPNTSVTTDGRRLICVNGARPTAWDREENTPTSGVVVSPSVLGQQQYCGEASVFAWNSAGVSRALGASVAVSAIEVSYNAGWARLGTTVKAADTSTTVNLPIIGNAFQKATWGAQGFGVTQEYRFTR